VRARATCASRSRRTRESTAAGARKWVLAPFETVVISGWQTSQTQARRFEFTTEENSYGTALGKTANLGVISAVFFKERVVTYMPEPQKNQARRQPSPSAPAESAIGSRDERAKDKYAATVVKLGVLTPAPAPDPLLRRERARASAFAPSRRAGNSGSMMPRKESGNEARTFSRGGIGDVVADDVCRCAIVFRQGRLDSDANA